MWMLIVLAPVVIPAFDQPMVLLDLPTGGVLLPQRDVQSIRSVVGVIQQHTHSNRAMLALPYCPMFYFLAERRNPTRWNYLWPGDQTDEDHHQLIEQARRDPPAAVVVIEEEAMKDYAAPVLEYVRSSFRLAGNLGRLNVYVQAGGQNP
jgi:hypothetical protein